MDTKENRKMWEREQKRSRISKIALEIFYEKGYENTTIDEIAKQSGYTKRTIYNYFNDKEDIFLSIVLKALEIFNQFLIEAYENPIERHSRLYSMGKAFFKFSKQYPKHFDLMMIYEARNCIYYPSKTYIDGYLLKCQNISDKNTQIVIKAIEDAINKGQLVSSLKPRQLLVILWGQVFGISQILRMRREHIEEAYEIDDETLYNYFLEKTEQALKNF